MKPKVSRLSQSKVSIVQRKKQKDVRSGTPDVMTMVAEPGKQVIGSSWVFGTTQRVETYSTRIVYPLLLGSACFKVI